MSQVTSIQHHRDLAERFWAIARSMDGAEPDQRDPVAVVKHVLCILDALYRGEQGADLSVHTLSFLRLLRESEHLGDLAYASPEQIRGEDLDERSLVFSVGVLLFERLTGRHPFGADHDRRVARIRKGELGSGVNYFPTVPAGLRSVLMRAMGPFREERFTSLAELRARLEQFINDQEPARPLPGTAPVKTASTRVVRMPASFARDLMAVAEAHESTVKTRRKNELARPFASMTQSAGSAQTPAGSPASPDEDEPEVVLLRPAVLRAMATGRTTALTQAVSEPAPAKTAAATDQSAAILASASRQTKPLPVMPTASEPAVAEPAPAGVHAQRTTEPLPAELTPQAAVVAPVVREISAPTAGEIAPVLRRARPQRAPAALISRLLWLSLGAGLAVAIMIIAWPQPELPAKQPAPAAAPQPVILPSEPAAEPPPPVFDAAQGGTLAAERARACFAPARLETGVAFRVGLLFPAHSGGVSKVYFGSAEELAASERLCLREQLMGLSAVAPPERNIVVNYQIHLTGDASQASIK